MAIINLSNEKIESLNSEIGSLDSTLLNSYFPQLKEIIGRIKSNVLNDQVNQILGNISTQVDTISGELSTDLPRLEEFLTSQMQQYVTSESEAEAKVNAVLQKMNSFSGNEGNATANGTSATGTGSTGQGGNAQQNANNYEHGWGEKYAETWSTWWGDVQEAYSDTHGLLSGICNTAEAVLDTGGAVIETVGNGLSDGLHAVGNVVSCVPNVVGWIFS